MKFVRTTVLALFAALLVSQVIHAGVAQKRNFLDSLFGGGSDSRRNGGALSSILGGGSDSRRNGGVLSSILGGGSRDRSSSTSSLMRLGQDYLRSGGSKTSTLLRFGKDYLTNRFGRFGGSSKPSKSGGLFDMFKGKSQRAGSGINRGSDRYSGGRSSNGQIDWSKVTMDGARGKDREAYKKGLESLADLM